MAKKLAWLLALVGVFAGGPAWAQQKPWTPSNFGARAKIKCHDQPYVSMTADAEQAIPPRVVATVACNEAVIILSDSQTYTVQIQTASGDVGYVTRYEVVLDSSTKDSMKESSAVQSAPSSAKTDTSGSQAQSQEAKRLAEQNHATDQKGQAKPRIYVSDTQSFAESGGFGNSSTVAAGDLYGGYNPDMVDIYQDFTSDCPGVVVTQEKSNADYAVLFDKGSGKKGLTGFGGLVKVNKVTVVSRSGETLVSQSSHSADTVVKVACNVVTQKGAANGSSQTSKMVH